MYVVIAGSNGRSEVFGLGGGGNEIGDISTNREAMELLAWRCCKGGLDPCHLSNVAEDWIQEEAMI